MQNIIHFSGDVKEYGGQFNFGNYITYDSEEVDAIVLLGKKNFEVLNKPYVDYRLNDIARHKNEWISIYSRREAKQELDKSSYSKEHHKFLMDLYYEKDIVAILKVTHFQVYDVRSNESGLNVKFKANVVETLKGKYEKKTLEFHENFDNSPDAQIYMLTCNKSRTECASDEFFQFIM